MAYFWLVFTCAFLLFFFKRLTSRSLSLPKARSVPILGSLPFMSFDLSKDLANLGRDLGPSFLLPLGFGREALVLNSAEVIHRAFHIEAFSGRPLTSSSRVVLEGGQTAILCATSRDKSCKDSRGILFKGLKKVCSEDNKFYASCLMEAGEYLVEILSSGVGQEVDTRPLIQIVSSQISAALCFGRRIGVNDDFLENCMKPAVEFIKASEKHILWELVPSFGFLNKSRNKDLTKNYEKCLLYIKHACDSFQAKLDRLCLLDLLLNKSMFDRHRAASLISDIFMPGFVTISENLPWLLLIIAVRKDVQSLVHRELLNCNSEINCLTVPYTYACVMEALRMRPILFFGLCHSTTSDIEFLGHVIPSGTLVIPNYISASGDIQIFSDGHSFDPERFLENPDQKLEKALTFSTGLRRCPGDILAKQELFSLFVAIMQNFQVELADSSFENMLEKDCKGKVKAHKLIFKKII